MATQDSPNLYERLGGVYSIATVVDDLIDRVAWRSSKTTGFEIFAVAAASFNPASVRSRSRSRSRPPSATRPHRTLKIQKSICRDSIVSNSNSTASLRRLFQQYRSVASD